MDAACFIRANTALIAPPLVPEVRLHLAHEALPLWERTEAELEQLGLPPPYWAFAWAGGQALARYILDNPGIVAGKSVLDFAAGSGLVGIAAMMAGAAHATAGEIDATACAAIELNAKANGVVARHDEHGSDRQRCGLGHRPRRRRLLRKAARRPAAAVAHDPRPARRPGADRRPRALLLSEGRPHPAGDL